MEWWSTRLRLIARAWDDSSLGFSGTDIEILMNSLIINEFFRELYRITTLGFPDLPPPDFGR